MASMQPITIEFLGHSPDALRRISNRGWSGRCLMFDRLHIESVLSAEGISGLDVSGVYILVGPSRLGQDEEGRKFVVPQLYVGRADRVRDRIDSHDNNKKFWTIAIVFYGEPHLNAAHIGYLEYRLITEASSADIEGVDMENIQKPRQPRHDPNVEREMDDFLVNMKSMLLALGHDFFNFRKARLPVVQVQEDARQHTVSDAITSGAQLTIPPNLEAVIKRVETACLEIPGSAFYLTGTDIRVKAAVGRRSRVYLLMQLRKHGLRLIIIDVATFNIGENAEIDAAIRQQILEGHKLAVQKLSK